MALAVTGMKLLSWALEDKSSTPTPLGLFVPLLLYHQHKIVLWTTQRRIEVVIFSNMLNGHHHCQKLSWQDIAMT
jgi:hypothetical protein